MQKLLFKIKKVTLTDIIGIIKFLIVLIPALLKKAYLNLQNKEVWLICETKTSAHDNGYIFYKYVRINHPEVNCYYAIDYKSEDYQKVKKYNKTIKWGSLYHYYTYMSCSKNISSHKEGNPNHLLFTILHLYFNLFNNRVFLQHGVLYQDYEMFYQKNTKFKVFITGAKPEYEFVKTKYGYKNNEIKYTGLARFDNLHDFKVDNKIILYIPTWRRWLDTKDKFENSNYYKRISSLINNKELEEILERNNKYLYFYLHQSTEKYINLYNKHNKRIRILNSKTADIQDLLKKGALLITDYSSIFTDFVYMKKPIIYYQYDKEEFINKHISNYRKSYFDFEKDGFGKVLNKEEDLLKEINYFIKNNFQIRKNHLKKIQDFFIIYDNKNCERIYNYLMEVK